MTRSPCRLGLVLLLPLLAAPALPAQEAGDGESGTPVLFLRGDSNADGLVDISDPILTLGFLFLGDAIDCEDAADADDSGVVDISDSLHVLSFLYLGGSPMPSPHAAYGEDPTADDLGCEKSGHVGQEAEEEWWEYYDEEDWWEYQDPCCQDWEFGQGVDIGP